MDKNAIKDAGKRFSGNPVDIFNGLLDENDKEILDRETTEVDAAFSVGDELTFLEPKTTGKYSLQEKVMVIYSLLASQREYHGAFVPDFAQIARQWNLSVGTVKGWWDTRKEIAKRAGVFIGNMAGYMTLSMGAQALRIVDEISKRDLSTVGVKDLTYAMGQLVNKMLVLGHVGNDAKKGTGKRGEGFNPIPKQIGEKGEPQEANFTEKNEEVI